MLYMHMLSTIIEIILCISTELLLRVCHGFESHPLS